jgi:glucose-6-phosphate isomerase
VGGRYSVFSAVGLFPLMLAGIDTEKLLKGARVMHDRCIKKDVSENPALASAALVYLHSQKGVSISNTFFFNPYLESVGKWYRQLMGESIGKKYSIEGKEVNAGITPIVSVGSTDLHSMVQLYLGGPKNKFTTFVYAPGNSKEIVVPKDLVFPSLAEGLPGKELSEIMSAIFNGVKEAYKKNNLPFVEVVLEDTSEYTLGQFLQFKMFEIMYLARLFEVNAFDQPNVEDYKKETRRILNEDK